MDTEKEPTHATDSDLASAAFRVERIEKALLGDFTHGAPWSDFLRKENLGAGASNVLSERGRKAQPANFEMCGKFKTLNDFHATCIETEVTSTVGLGFKTDDEEPAPVLGQAPKKPVSTQSIVDKKLDPFCVRSFGFVLRQIAEDFFSTGNGYMEVVRDTVGGKISGIHHMPSPRTFVFVEDDGRTFHYEFDSHVGAAPIKYPRFGDSERFYAKFKEARQKTDGTTASEIIHFADPTALSRWYGLPKWLANTVAMELFQACDQREFDFFINRGVPEFILFLLGAKVGKPDWDVIKEAINGHIGLGNSHKTMAVNLSDPNLKAQVEKLDAEGADQGDRYSNMVNVLALRTASAHQMPPLLAGIVLPGKMAAANELPNAIKAFQLLKIGPAQKVFKDTLATTLGDETENKGLGLSADAFTLKKLTDELDLNAMDTSSRMRQTEPEAASQGRNLADGLKKEITDDDEERAGAVLAAGLAHLMAEARGRNGKHERR